MSIHIGAKKGDIAETVLLPGDPMRAKYVADNFLKNVECFTRVRGMFGYTGEYNGQRVSIQGTGMGIPSCSIYIHELINEYGAQKLIRVGSCGSIHESLVVRDVVLAMSASTDSHVNKLRFDGCDYAPTADFGLLQNAYQFANEKNIGVKVGSIFSTDRFYHDNPEYWKKWASFGALAIEMETAALYTMAAQFNVAALSILTVSDDILRGDIIPSDQRETSFMQMFEIALELA